MGSDTVAETELKSLSFSSRLARLRPMQTMAATVRSAPRSKPGKNPARMATGGNLFSRWSAVAVASAEVCDAALAVWLAAEVPLAVEEAEADVDFEVPAAVLDTAVVCITHLSLEQLKPFGQHVFFPHVWREPVRSVLCS